MDFPGPIHDFLLVFLGSVLLLGGLGVVLLSNPVFSAFSLGLVLVCISIFRIPSNSHFVAAAQLLIYMEAINVLIVFDVMFMNDSEYDKDFGLWTVEEGVTSLVCTSLFVSLITTVPETSWYGIIWTTRSNQIVEQDFLNNGQQIGTHLSSDFLGIRTRFNCISPLFSALGNRIGGSGTLSRVSSDSLSRVSSASLSRVSLVL